MKIGKSRPTDQDTPTIGIMAENYFERAKAFVGAHGAGFVIRALDGTDGHFATKQPATEAQWIAWMGYFASKGITHAYLLRRGMGTVPTEWPEEFDLEAPTSDRMNRLPRRAPFRDPEMCRRLAALFRDVAKEMEALPKKKPAWREREAARKLSLEELAASWRENPVQLSNELRGETVERNMDEPSWVSELTEEIVEF
jgi:hypothetical protein